MATPVELSWLLDLNELEASLGHPGVPTAPIPPLGEWHWLPVVTETWLSLTQTQSSCVLRRSCPGLGRGGCPCCPFPVQFGKSPMFQRLLCKPLRVLMGHLGGSSPVCSSNACTGSFSRCFWSFCLSFEH